MFPMDDFGGGGWDDWESAAFADEQDPMMALVQQLPRGPVQSPIIDPAQEAFQYPFQFPGSIAGEGEAQAAPVDVPDNALQEAFDPWQAWADLNSEGDENEKFMGGFNPNSSLVENAWEMTKNMIEDQGFDLGVFKEFDLGKSLVSNIWDAMKWADENPEMAWDWAGDFPQLLGMGQKMTSAGDAEVPIKESSADDLGDAYTDWLADIIIGKGGNEVVLGNLSRSEIAGDEIATAAVGESALAALESPVVENVEMSAANAIDTTSSSVSTGADVALSGLDVLPAISDLLDLAASLIL